MPLPLSTQWAGDVHISGAAPGMHHRGLMRGGELCSLRSLPLLRMLFPNFNFCSSLLLELRLGGARALPGSLPCLLGVRAARALLCSDVPPVPPLPLLPAARAHKKKRAGFGPREMMRSKCFLGSSLFFYLVLFCFLFYFISLLLPLSRQPLLPHLRGICFTQRAPGEWRTNAAPALRGRGRSGSRPGLRSRDGGAVPSAHPERGKGEGLENPPPLLLQGSCPPEGGLVICKFCLCSLQPLSSASLRPNGHFSSVLLSGPLLSSSKWDY